MRTCVVCAIVFVSQRMGRKRSYCSRVCKKRVSRTRDRKTAAWRAGHKRAKAMRRGAVRGSNVVAAHVYERDGWMCWICEAPLDRAAVVPAYEAPTLDHVVALALGGEHTMDNLRAAHFICNSRRGVGGGHLETLGDRLATAWRARGESREISNSTRNYPA
jgi:5-methylcytosine-specific restriction endonuclease McrA